MTASEALASLDRFLEDICIHELDHLSGSTINGSNYSTDYPDDFFFFGEGEEEEIEEEELSEEEQEKALREFVDELISQSTERFASYLGVPSNPDSLPTEWFAEIKKPRSLYELVDFLKAEQVRMTKEERSIWKSENNRLSEEGRIKLLILEYQKL